MCAILQLVSAPLNPISDIISYHIGYASKMALGSVLDALSDTRLATSSSLVTRHFTFDRSFIEHITVNK